MIWLAILGVAVAGVVIYFKFVQAEQSTKSTQTTKGSQGFAYQQQKNFLTPAEYSFYRVLQQAVGDQLTIFCKVRIADLIKPQSGLVRSEWQRAFNKISAKHCDFILCDVETLSVKAALELDDRSHQKKSRVQRDDFLNQALATAKLPLIRVPVQASYSVADIRSQLTPFLQ
ncbi:MAG: DUF2726 domain-containing protein [Cyanobacteria bacterium P01_H01_bin.121]